MSARPGRDPLLTLSAVLGALVVAVVAVLGLTHSRPVAFRSGSMAPTIDTGAVAVVHQVPAADLRVGDVVTVPTDGAFVTHRIVQVTQADGEATLQLKGDANRTPDAQLYQVASAERVVLSVPYLGYVLAGVTGPFGLVLLATYVVWLLRRVLVGVPRPPRPPTRPTHRAPQPGRRHRRRVAVGAVAVVVVGATTVAGSPKVWAAGWVDTVAVSGSTLSTATVAPPATFTCAALGIGTVRFNWSAVTNATDYQVLVNGVVRATTTALTATVDSMGGSGTAYVVARRAFASTTWVSTASVTRSYSTTAVLTTCS